MVLVIVGDEQKMACEIYQMPSVSRVQTSFFCVINAIESASSTALILDKDEFDEEHQKRHKKPASTKNDWGGNVSGNASSVISVGVNRPVPRCENTLYCRI